MAKRTYSRRNMTKVPDEHDSPPDDSFKRKRRKSDVKNSSRSRYGATPSPPPRRPSRALPKSKKFSGPVCVPDEAMDLDESPRGRDVFAGALKMAKAKGGLDKSAQSGGSLHGGREGFNKLIAANKTNTKATAFPKDRQSHEDQSSYGSNGNRNLPENGHAKASKHATGTANVRNKEQYETSHNLTDLADTLSKAKLVLKEKAYMSSKMEPRSKDLLGRRTQEDSKAKWMENQSNSPFLRLPGEVRNRIYEFALGGKTIIIDYVTYDSLEIEGQLQTAVPIFKYRYEVHEKRHNPFQEYTPEDLEISTSFTLLNQVCRQLYLETAILPYKLNSWAFTSHNIMWNFLAMERRFTR